MSETKERWTVGVDPGLKETGLHLLDGSGNPVTGATIKADDAKRPDLERIYRLARAVVAEINVWCARMPLTCIVRVGIEYPIMRAGNVVNYAKQISTVYAIEHEMLSQGFEVELVEVNPSTVKQAGTGSGAATKKEIIAASPYSGSGHTIETLADAWAVARAAREASEFVVLNTGKLRRSPYPIEARGEVL